MTLQSRWLITVACVLGLLVQGLGGPGLGLCIGCDAGDEIVALAGPCHDRDCAGHESPDQPRADFPDCGCIDVVVVSVPTVVPERAAGGQSVAAAPTCAVAAAPPPCVSVAAIWGAFERSAPLVPRRGHAARSAARLL